MTSNILARAKRPADIPQTPATPPAPPETEASLLAHAHELAREFAQQAADHDRTGAVPADQITALFRRGLLRLTIARRDGGHGAGLPLARRIVQTLAEGDPSVALIVAMHYSYHAGIARARRKLPGAQSWPEALARTLIQDALQAPALINAIQVEPELGSPSFGGLPKTIARQEGRHWRITGHKRYATGSHLLSWLAVLAMTDEASPRIGVFLVPRQAPGVHIIETWNPLGMRATASHDIQFQDVAIPLNQVIELHEASQGLRRDPQTLSWYFSLIASVYTGAAQSAQDWLAQFLTQRRPSALAGGSLADLPTVQDTVGRIQLWLDASNALLDHHADAYDQGAADAAALGAVAKYTAVENAVQATALALELAGNHGLSRDNPLERHYRDTQCARIHSPPNPLLRGNAGRAILQKASAGSSAPRPPA